MELLESLVFPFQLQFQCPSFAESVVYKDYKDKMQHDRQNFIKNTRIQSFKKFIKHEVGIRARFNQQRERRETLSHRDRML